MKRREFITLLGGAAVALAARGARAAYAAGWRADEPRRRRSGRAGAPGGVPAGAAGVGLGDGRNLRIDIRWGDNDPTESAETWRNWSRPRLTSSWPPASPVFAALQARPVRADRVHGRHRSDRRRLRRQLHRPGGNITGLYHDSDTALARNGWSCSRTLPRA